MKSKKGELLPEETLKVVLALIGLLILAALLFSIYNVTKRNEKFEQAEATFDYLFEQINSLSSDDEISVTVFSPSGWLLGAWPYDAGDKVIVPAVCAGLIGESCLCACPLRDENAKLSDQKFANECAVNGVCAASPKKIYLVDWLQEGELGKGRVLRDKVITINPPLHLKIDSYENNIYLQEEIN